MLNISSPDPHPDDPAKHQPDHPEVAIGGHLSGTTDIGQAQAARGGEVVINGALDAGTASSNELSGAAQTGRSLTGPGLNPVLGSLTASLQSTFDWAKVETAIRLANLIHPGMGAIIRVFDVIVSAWNDLGALGDPDVPRIMQVPLLNINRTSVNLHFTLAASNGSRGSGAAMSVVISPEMDDPFAGYAIEKVDEKEDGKHVIRVYAVKDEEPDGPEVAKGLSARVIEIPLPLYETHGKPVRPTGVGRSHQPTALIAVTDLATMKLSVSSTGGARSSTENSDQRTKSQQLFEIIRRWLAASKDRDLPDMIVMVDPETGAMVRIIRSRGRAGSSACWRVEVTVGGKTGVTIVTSTS